MNISIVEVIEQTVRAHYNEVSPWNDLVLIIKGFVRQFTTGTTLVWKVEPILLLFRPECLSQLNLTGITFNLM